LIGLARLLTPDQFGEAIMATIVVGLASTVADFGIGVLIVQRRDLDPRRAARVGLGTGLGVALLVFLGAPWLSGLLGGGAHVTDLLRIGAVGVGLVGLGAAARGGLERDLRFGQIAGIEAAVAVSAAVVKIILALADMGSMSIILGDAAGAVLYTAAMLRAAAPTIAPGTPGPATPIFRDGARIVGTRIFDTGFGQIDRFLIGRLLGATVLGLYGFAYQHAMLLATRLGPVGERVALPLLSRLRDQPAAFADAYSVLTRIHSLALAGPALLLYAVAPTLVGWLYPERWNDALPAIRALCLAAAAHGLNSRPGLVWIALGRMRMRLLWSATNLGITAVILWFAVPHGLVTTAYALAARSVAAAVLAQWLTHCIAPSIRHTMFLRAIAPAALLTTVLLLLHALV